MKQRIVSRISSKLFVGVLMGVTALSGFPGRVATAEQRPFAEIVMHIGQGSVLPAPLKVDGQGGPPPSGRAYPLTKHNEKKVSTNSELLRIGVLTCGPSSHVISVWGPIINPTDGRTRMTGMIMTHVWDVNEEDMKSFAEKYGGQGGRHSHVGFRRGAGLQASCPSVS